MHDDDDKRPCAKGEEESKRRVCPPLKGAKSPVCVRGLESKQGNGNVAVPDTCRSSLLRTRVLCARARWYLTINSASSELHVRGLLRETSAECETWHVDV